MLLLLIPHLSLPITEVNILYATRQANLVFVGAIITSSIWHVLQGAEQAFHDMPASRNHGRIARIARASTIDGACVVGSNLFIFC